MAICHGNMSIVYKCILFYINCINIHVQYMYLHTCTCSWHFIELQKTVQYNLPISNSAHSSLNNLVLKVNSWYSEHFQTSFKHTRITQNKCRWNNLLPDCIYIRLCSVRVKHCVPEAEQRGGWCQPPSPCTDVPPGDADWVPGRGRFPFPRYSGIPRSRHWRTAPSWLGSRPPTTEPAVLVFSELNTSDKWKSSHLLWIFFHAKNIDIHLFFFIGCDGNK